MVVRSLNKNITCLGRTTSWTQGAQLQLSGEVNDIILKQTKIWFSAGCRGQVQIRIRLNGNVLLPDPLNNYSDSYIGSDITFPIYVGKRLHQADILFIDYMNSDTSVHTVSVLYEFQPLPTAETQTKIVAGPTPTPTAKKPKPKPGVIIPKKQEVKRDYVMREDKMGRYGDESERAYIGEETTGEKLPDWLEMDGQPTTPVHDPRKRRYRT
jgi:hypothetical protein